MRFSFSSIKTFNECQRRFYYKYIAQFKYTDKYDDKYARFGSCIHKIIEEYDEELEDTLITKYYNQYDLLDSYNRNEIEKCIDNFKNRGYKIKSNEKTIFINYNDYIFMGIIDAILDDNRIIDWKTSKYSKQKELEYLEQAKFYAWLYYQKFKEIPPEVIIYFIKEDIEVKQPITINDIYEVSNKIDSFLKELSSKKGFNDYKQSNNHKICKWCPYKKKCFEDSYLYKDDIIITIELYNNKLKIKTVRKLQEIIDKYLEKQLSYEIDNKYWIQKSLAKRGIKFDGIIKLYKNGSTYLGFKNYIINLLKNKLAPNLEKKGYKTTIKIIDKRTPPNILANIPTKKLNGIKLRDYQLEAIKYAIKNEICLLELCTGAGKTIIATELIRQLNYKTLFVVNTLDLLQQTKEVFEKLLNIEIGTITEGKQNWKDVNVATIQTVVKFIEKRDKEFLKKLHEINLLIVDECHLAKSKSYDLLMKNVKAKYRIGLSATPFSNGNNSLELYKSFGFPEFKISLMDLIKMKYLIYPQIKFIIYLNNEHYLDYQEAYNKILSSKERLNIVKKIVEKHKNDYILIITRKLEHAEKIKELLGGDVEIINGKLNKRKRKQLLDEMKNGKRHILIGTDKIVSTGLDLPILNVLINYSANLSKIQTIQTLGRICRKHENKHTAYYYDFWDTNEHLIKATRERYKAFKELGFEPKIINENELID